MFLIFYSTSLNHISLLIIPLFYIFFINSNRFLRTKKSIYKSSLMTEAKKKIIRINEHRVRFADNISSNHISPLYSMPNYQDDDDEKKECQSNDENEISSNHKIETENTNKQSISLDTSPTYSMPQNILKVHLENGQTKSFLFDSSTTVLVSLDNFFFL